MGMPAAYVVVKLLKLELHTAYFTRLSVLCSGIVWRPAALTRSTVFKACYIPSM